MLKTFQCLGYFVKVADVPNSVIRCIAKAAGFEELPDLSGYDKKTVRAEHKDLIRSWVGVSAFDTAAKRAMLKACVDISRVREDLADIVNFAIEELIRQKYELPAFSALLRAAMKVRAAVNRGLYTRITKALDPAAKQRIDQLFTRLPEGRRTGWDVIKSEPRQPTVKEIRRFVEHLNLASCTGRRERPACWDSSGEAGPVHRRRTRIERSPHGRADRKAFLVHATTQLPGVKYNFRTSAVLRARLYIRTSSILPPNLIQLPYPP
jgi:hypothetical protein